MGKMSEIDLGRQEAAALDPRDPDPSREGMWRYHNCSYCDDGRKPCKQGGTHRCSNPHARND